MGCNSSIRIITRRIRKATCDSLEECRSDRVHKILILLNKIQILPTCKTSHPQLLLQKQSIDITFVV